MIVLNVFQHSTTLPGHEGSFKNHWNAVLNDPKCQRRGFWPFSGCWSVGLTWYCILWWCTKCFSVWQLYQVMKDHSKITKMHFECSRVWSVALTRYCRLWYYFKFFDIRLFWVFCFYFSCFSFKFFCCLLVQWLKILSNSDVELGGFHRYSSQRQLRSGFLFAVR